MAEQIEPAMSPEGWLKVLGTANGKWTLAESLVHIATGECYPNLPANTDDRHSLAALCLHGQPFGFTWEDVSRLRASADVAIRTAESVVASLNSGTQAHIVIEQAIIASKRYRSLAARIASLLPPRQP